MSYIQKTTGRLIAVGDIHGQAGYLRLVLEAIDPKSDDVIVFLGDLVNRGPDSKGVVDQVIDLAEKCQVYSILGNHEEMILGAFAGGASDHKFWCKFGGVQTLASYGVDHVSKIPGQHMMFFANCKDYLETDDFIFVHAGCDPNIPLNKNSGALLRWERFPKNPTPHMSGKTVVCGHTAQKTVLDLGFLICLDTGSGIWPGGRVTAMDLKSGKIWQAGGRNKKATVKQRQTNETVSGESEPQSESG